MSYTFLLPAFKNAFLVEALRSIKNQTYKEFKCLVSDDCSPDDIKSIFDRTVGNDPRFVYRRNEENIGSKSLVAHWNLLVDLCDTDYLIMASDDDLYEPEFLAEIDVLVNKYQEIDVFRAKAKRIENKFVLEEDGDIPELLGLEDFLIYFGKKPMVHCLANYVFKTTALNGVGGFPDFPKAGYSDAAVAMVLAKNGIVTTKNVLFSFRMSKENLSSTNGYNKYSEDGIKGCVMFADWYKENIKSYIVHSANIHEISEAHYNHVVGVAQYFMARLPLFKAIKYYLKLRARGYMNLKSSLTAIKNWIKVK